jgi:hypothetical protein
MDGGNEQRIAIKFCLKDSLSVAETLVLVQKACGIEALNRSNVFLLVFSILRQKGAGRRRWKRWPAKIDSNLVNIAAVADLVKKDGRITSRMITRSLNIPKTIVLRILKADLGKISCVQFCSTVLDTWAKGRSRQTCQDSTVVAYADIFFTKLLREMRPGVLPMNPKQSEKVLNRLVRHPFGRRNGNSKGPAWRKCR